MTMYRDTFTIEDFVGRTCKKVEYSEHESEVDFTFDDGFKVQMFHMQDCCESVTLDHTDFDLGILIGVPILHASVEEEQGTSDDGWADSVTKTVFTFTTERGTLVIPWTGTSNGYYSETVDLWVDRASIN